MGSRLWEIGVMPESGHDRIVQERTGFTEKLKIHKFESSRGLGFFICDFFFRFFFFIVVQVQLSLFTSPHCSSVTLYSKKLWFFIIP